jgi:hypothetical protein
MELNCDRCRQTIEADDCFCSNCGLPRLVYATDGAAGHAQPEPWNEAVRDAGSIDWKPALRAALLLALPAGILSSTATPLGRLGMVWMSTAASLAVMLYLRGKSPAWITTGAGARIGLVTGVLAAWLSFGLSGAALYVDRYGFHHAAQIDADYSAVFVDSFQQQAQRTMAGMNPADLAQAQAVFGGMQAWMTSPEGHATMWVGSIAFGSFFLLLFAVAGGALGARLMARRRLPAV